jgi:hypothetical protein
MSYAFPGRARRCARKHKKWAAMNTRTDANVERVQTLVRSDRRLGVRLIAEELNTGICWEEGPEPWPDKWILHHDHDAAHDTLRVREFLAKKHIAKMDHPPYSSELALETFGSLQK